MLPKQIAIPLYEVSQAVGLKPIICHASACLANYQTVNQISGHQRFKADDMKLIAARFIKHRGNEWFFLVAAQVCYIYLVIKIIFFSFYILKSLYLLDSNICGFILVYIGGI